MLESLTGFALSHGEAVCLGIACALDVGRQLGVTERLAAAEVEAAFTALAAPGRPAWARSTLARSLAGKREGAIARLLATDKKAGSGGELRLVLLERPGSARVEAVSPRVWRRLLPFWRMGVRP